MIITGINATGGMSLQNLPPIPTGYYFAVVSNIPNGFDILVSTSYSIPSGFSLVTSDTWDPSRNGVGNNLSNNNLALRTTANNNTTFTTKQIFKGDKVIMSFKMYNTGGLGDNLIVGIAQTGLVNSGQWTGSTAGFYNAGFYDDGPYIINNNETFSTGLTKLRNAGDIIDLAIDEPNKKMWKRINGNPWMALDAAKTTDVGADPATNTGGINISALIGL